MKENLLNEDNNELKPYDLNNREEDERVEKFSYLLQNHIIFHVSIHI